MASAITRPVNVGPCHCGNQRSGIAASCRNGHRATRASGASQVGDHSHASAVSASETGRSTATMGTTSRFASGAVSARLPNASTVTGEVSTNGPRQPRQSCSQCRRHRTASSGSGTCAAASRPTTPATERANPASSAVAGAKRIRTTAENASDSSASMRRPRERANSSTLAIHADRNVAVAAPVRSVYSQTTASAGHSSSRSRGQRRKSRGHRRVSNHASTPWLSISTMARWLPDTAMACAVPVARSQSSKSGSSSLPSPSASAASTPPS